MPGIEIQLGAIGLSILFAYGFIQGLQNKTEPASVVDDSHIIRREKQKEERFVLNQVHNDAIAALVSLGTKKKEAKGVVTRLAQQRQYSTVNEIILDAYRMVK